MIKVNSIIIIQLTAIGDTLMCEPALYALRKTYPQARITFLTSDSSAPILENNPHINNLIIWKKKIPLLKNIFFLLSLCYNRFDILVDFQKNPRTYVMSHFIRARLKISFRGKHRNCIYSRLSPPIDVQKYAAFEKFAVVKSILNQDIQPVEPRVYITDQDRQLAQEIFDKLRINQEHLTIAVSPVSKVPYRTWKSHNFSKLCDHIYSHYQVNFLFTWGPGEKYLVDEVIKGMKTHKPSTEYEIGSLKVLYALFEKSDMYLGNDNGPRHLAIAAGIPTMCIFGHFFCNHWTPPNKTKHAYVLPKAKETSRNNERIDSVDYQEAQDVCIRALEPIVKNKQELTGRNYEHTYLDRI